MRTHIALVGSMVLFSLTALAQDLKSAYCNFDDDNQITIQYNSTVKEPPRNGKIWSPGATLYVPVQVAADSIDDSPRPCQRK